MRALFQLDAVFAYLQYELAFFLVPPCILFSNMGSVTMPALSRTDGATTLSHMNLSGYVGHVTILVECSLLRDVQ